MRSTAASLKLMIAGTEVICYLINGLWGSATPSRSLCRVADISFVGGLTKETSEPALGAVKALD